MGRTLHTMNKLGTKEQEWCYELLIQSVIFSTNKGPRDSLMLIILQSIQCHSTSHSKRFHTAAFGIRYNPRHVLPFALPRNIPSTPTCLALRC